MGTPLEKAEYLKETKEIIKDAIVAKGQTIADNATFRSYADKIAAIETGIDLPTLSRPASASHILYGREAINASGAKITGTIQSLTVDDITPGTGDVYINGNRYLSSGFSVIGDANLTSDNIKKGETIFGVPGEYEGPYKLHSMAREQIVSIDITGINIALPSDMSSFDMCRSFYMSFSNSDIEVYIFKVGMNFYCGRMYIQDGGSDFDVCETAINLDDTIRFYPGFTISSWVSVSDFDSGLFIYEP